MIDDNAQWPIGELADRVAVALSEGYAGPPSGRVRGVPDVRAIRWYSTIGLLDKPGGHRARTALYGLRHLRQLVAVKRRQAEGVPLVEIQAELAGASDSRLAALARVPAESAALEPQVPEGSSDDGVGTVSEPIASPSSPESARPDTRFWAQGSPTVTVAERAEPSPVGMSYGVELAPGITVLVAAPRPLDSDDIAAIQQGAAPLLRVLRTRGLHEQESVDDPSYR